jgi:cell division protein FtsQ
MNSQETDEPTQPAIPGRKNRRKQGGPADDDAVRARVEDRAVTDPGASAPVRPGRERRPWFGFRRSNRRITVESRSPAVWVGDRLAALARRLLGLGKVAAAALVLVLVVLIGRLAVGHVVASPRFSVREVRATPSVHAGTDELVRLAGVSLGDRLLAVDTDAVAARLARHPWVAAAHVRRELPSTLAIDVVERRAFAAALVQGAGLYLVDEAGRPFKRATLDEADGLVVLTGVSRAQYAALSAASEAAFREALDLLALYRRAGAGEGDGAGGEGRRPALSEIHIDPRNGYSLFFYEGGGEIRLGRGRYPEKLERLDRILGALPRAGRGGRGAAALRTLHLDGPSLDRVPIRLADAAPADAAPAAAAGALSPASPAPAAPKLKEKVKEKVKKSTAPANAGISAETLPAADVPAQDAD